MQSPLCISVKQRFLRWLFVVCALTWGDFCLGAEEVINETGTGPPRLATFAVDVTPPLGHPLFGSISPPAREIGEPLSARGLVLLGAGEPIIIVSVDWLEIRNDAYRAWRVALADAAGTSPERVLVSCVHQHDAPLADLAAQQILTDHELAGQWIDPVFHRRAVKDVAEALRAALPKAQPVTHLGMGKALVEGVASNRRYLAADGKPRHDRGSATTDLYMRLQPDGAIDPWLRTLSFWNGDRPLVALSAYATHPMSYYRTGRVSSDFPGIARQRRQGEMPDTLQIYFSGASGNVTAGKYNDGNPANRTVLADRLHAAMREAWVGTRRLPIENVQFRSVSFELPPRDEPGFRIPDLEAKLVATQEPRSQCLAALGLSWRQRYAAGEQLDLPALDFGTAVFLLLPAESYVEYQLLASRLRPDDFVVVVGYGECGPGYIPHEQAWSENDANLNDWCWVAPGAEPLLAAAIRKALGVNATSVQGAGDEAETAASDALPEVSDRSPVPVPHFPSAVHAVVWRNWQLVSPERLAAVLETSPENVTDLAASMGLPRKVSAPRDMRERGYITIVRRNWHLLPYDQLLQLLDMTAEEFAFRLREDDFLYHKLGQLKPRCEPVKYREPDDAARRRAAEISDIVRKHFGRALSQPTEPRFGFIDEFTKENNSLATDVTTKADESPRYIYSYFAVFGDPLANPRLDPFPDGLLARLRAQGVNGIWLHTVLRQLAPGGKAFPEFGEGHEARLRNLRNLVDRAKRHNIDVYLYMNEPRAMPHEFFSQRPEMAGVKENEYTAMCTSDPRVRQWLSDSLAYVFEKVPDLGGIFTITASENLTNCASHTNKQVCPRCAKRSESDIVAEVMRAMEEGVHRSAPDAKVIAWDWGWGWAWNNHDEARTTIAKLPKSVWLQSVSEWSLPIERGGVKATVGEYSISAVGPGPRATLHWADAKQHGLKTVAKVAFNNTWELSAVPYLPVLDLVAEHCERLAKANVDGMMLSWSLGGYPSPNLELASRLSARPAPKASEALDALAEKHFGPDAAPRVRRAWTKFSRAFQEYPYDGSVLYSAPQQMGPANLLYGKPTGYSATMVGFPYDDLARWRGPYPPEIFAGQFEKVAEGWADGLAELESAQALVPEDLRQLAAADLRVARAAHVHFASVANQARFVMTRDALAAARDEEETAKLREELKAILDREIELSRQMFALSSADSRLGYEASNHYFYVPLDLVEKVINCEELKGSILGPTRGR